MSINSRLAKLEARHAPAPKVNTAITDKMYNRGMDTLAAALGEITGEAVTAQEAGQAIKELTHDH